MIAALPKAPSRINPITSPERALERRNYVLNRMLELDVENRRCVVEPGMVLDELNARQMQHLKKLVESRPMLLRIPDQSLIVGEKGEGVHHVRAARAY